jgi:hypothetical protein
LASTPTATKASYDLAAAAVPKSTVTTAGDVIYATGSGAVTRLGIGTAGQVLTVNGGAAAPSWATPTSGGMTLLNGSGTALSGASVSVSVTVTGYTSLTIYIKDAYGTVDDVQCAMRINNDSAANYAFSGTRFDGGATVTGVYQNNAGQIPYIFVQIPSNNTTLYKGNAKIDIFQPTATNNFGVVWQSVSTKNAGYVSNIAGAAVYDASAAITSLQFYPGSGNWAGGTVYVYGVK